MNRNDLKNYNSENDTSGKKKTGRTTLENDKYEKDSSKKKDYSVKGKSERATLKRNKLKDNFE